MKKLSVIMLGLFLTPFCATSCKKESYNPSHSDKFLASSVDVSGYFRWAHIQPVDPFIRNLVDELRIRYPNSNDVIVSSVNLSGCDYSVCLKAHVQAGAYSFAVISLYKRGNHWYVSHVHEENLNAPRQIR